MPSPSTNTPAAGSKRAGLISNIVVVAVTICLGLFLGEIGFRLIDGYRLDSVALVIRQGQDTEPAAASLHYAERLRIDPSFNVAWYAADPPDYNRAPKTAPLPADWVKAIAAYKPSPGERPFVKDELKFLYNYNWLVDACDTGEHSNVIKFYKKYPGFVYAFASPDSSTNPPYRLVPRRDRDWTVGQDYYNNFGFRGPDLTPHKPARVIRLAFLGASTSANGWPWTYPEYVAQFLRLWAKANNLDVDFDVINAGRGGTDSPIIAKIMRYEVAPLHPDIVVYYEGANDLHTDDIVRVPNVAPVATNPSVLLPNIDLTYLPLERYSALLDRVYELIYRRGGPAAEPPKPPHTLTFDLTQKDPNLNDPNLPFKLHRQIGDLRYMAASAKNVGADFFLTSFVTLVHEGLLLDPERDRIIWRGLNDEYAPLSYKEIREAVDFQNSAYRKLARTDGHPFLDVDKYFPQDPDFFADMVHFGTSGGFRLQGWIVAQLLAPYILEQIKNGALPRPAYDPDTKQIAWATAPPIKFNLSCLP